MFRKYLLFAIIVSMLNILFATSGLANTTDEKKVSNTEKVKAGIMRLGVGPDAKVEVKLYDQTTVKGYVKESNDERFIVVDSKMATSTEIPYPNVKQIKGNNLSKGVKFAIGLGILIGVLVIIAVAVGHGG